MEKIGVKQKSEKKGFIARALDRVERVGNGLPDPATLFILLALITIVTSFICAQAGVSVTYEGYNSATGKIEEVTVNAVNLLAPDSIRHMVTTVVSNFTSFFALGTVFTIILGVGVAEGTGFMAALLKKVVAVTPRKAVTAVVVFLGIMSNIASSTGYVVLVPLGAILFMAFKRHPIAGLAAAFAGVSGGWSANLLIGTNDPMFAGMSTQAAQMIDPNYAVMPIANWYYMFVSTFLITIIGTLVTEKLIEPRLAPFDFSSAGIVQDISVDEKRGIRFAGISALVYIAVMLLLILPQNALLRNPETGDILKSPFMSGIIFFMMLLFLIPGVFYGIGARVIKNDKDVIALMNKAISGLSSFMVLIFFAAQFTACFNYSNLGTIISVSGANFLKSVGFVGLPLIICFIVLTAFINIFIAVDSAKWAIMAPIFVPMFMRLGLSPELTQVAYRIGDSSTNIIAPLMPFFVLTVAFFQKYDKKAGIGSVISTMLPYSICFLLGWIVLFIGWYLLGLPLGPGAPLFYPAV
ncbi:AbgT family transporter [Geosporobacter ferrireducens]|uniref:Aminobenzoyl-glutamate transporter n=1 Tax=Geosporobacter ferrireducens TaxID=1424294 RepID=A0A1D8GJ60_9FIRM|nr:AbgT family transporter [Geosporobacter ferrireducens]AOT70946.1 aminobenzoyl-glutamate transporter [Geosporobacter ferrireducens]MTI53659.1 AbgT family transporter [Geosporobacter ferrireducens]